MPRLLHRPGHKADIFETVKLPFVRNSILRPEPGDDVNSLLEACPALLHAHSENVELLWDKGAPKAGVEPAVTDVIQHRQLGGELDGIVEGRYHGAGNQPDASSA